MRANDFVRRYGWGYAKEIVRKLSVNDTFYLNIGGEIIIEDLKRLVESHELVESFGGLDLAKECLSQLPNKHQSYTLTRDDTGKTTQSFKLQQAIADVESCQ